jgi:glutamine amidotransferase
MKPKIAIVDYGLGNLFSINQACEYVGLKSSITSDIKVIKEADGLILPGVGAFGDAMRSLHENNLINPLLEFAKNGKPFLGICLGMQLLFSESEEFGNNKGLNLIPGKIVRFPELDEYQLKLKVPQIQWNQVFLNTKKIWIDSPLKQVNNGAYMQFVHSYYGIPEKNEHILSFSEYGGIRYASSVINDNIIGFQFHPEKSAQQGIEIYKSWANFIITKSY